ncbi:hypothetical protein AK88_05566 [Plasmodium fragile]|uniref:Schizont-infected cell agglutination extracellular alpha domain-containing protein n=1 Tax=Plasmodium fragile TaxID=5857 RepID=A0A0D9QGG0_PLAFR|nr:uncharacterized protein AK88_05566 [Plasmodium fragile]KJP84806.1 hypothetical protein AK88_05566 [Plasmodium fragile]
MREVKIIFPEVTQSINQHSGKNAGICGSIYTGAESNVATCKSRCHEIASVMLYIKGYSYKNRAWTKRQVDQRWGDRFTEYLRCTLATEVLLQVYANTDDHRDVIKKVKEEMGKPDTTGNQKYGTGVCEDRNYGEAIFGLRGIGPSIKNQLEQWKSGLVGGHAGSARVTGKKCAWAEQDVEDSEQKCNVQSGQTPHDSALMQRINHWTEGGLYPRVKQLLQDMKAGRIPGGKCDMEKNIKKKIEDTVKQVKKTADKRDEGTVQVTASGAKDTAGAKSAPVQTAAKPAAGSEPPPQPVKPATAVKPVAAQPVPPATTTASAGGGCKAGSAAGGQQETGKKTKADDCLGDKILESTPKEVYVAYQYTVSKSKQRMEKEKRGIEGKHNLFIRLHEYVQDEHWNKVQSVLREFIEYLGDKNQDFDAHGANCDNIGWNDMVDTAYHKGQRVADMMRCRIMSGALWFANQSQGKQQKDKEVARLRCEVAHVLGHLLKEMYCKNQGGPKRGIEYAWETFRNMKTPGESGPPIVGGRVIEETCTECGYGENKTNITAINLRISQWLLQEGNISSEIAQMEPAMPCTIKWTDYINEAAQGEQYIKKGATEGKTIKESVSDVGKEKIKAAQKKMTAAVAEVLEKAKKEVEQHVQKQTKEGTNGNNTSTKNTGSTDKTARG